MHFESELEIAAIQAYHNDAWDSEDEHLFGRPLKHLPPGARVELKTYNPEDNTYEGGDNM